MGNTLMDVSGEEEILSRPINFRRSDTRRHLVSFDEGEREGVEDGDGVERNDSKESNSKESASASKMSLTMSAAESWA